MKKFLSVFLSCLLACSMFVPCLTFGVSADGAGITVDGKPDDSIWNDTFWNRVDKTNGQFQATYTNGLPDFAFEWAAEKVDNNLNIFVKINQGPHIDVPEGGTLSNTLATNVRLWIDNDMSDTARTTLFDFTYDGTGSKITRADKVNNVDVDTSKISHALTSGDDYTYFEISLPLDLVGYDPAKQFGIYFSVSDLNLTDTGDKYDALNASKYNGNAEAPWSTTKFYKSIFAYVVDGTPDDNVWVNAVWNKVDKDTGQFQATYTNGLPDFAFDWAVAKVKDNLTIFVKINQGPNIALPEGGTLSNTFATNVRLWVDNDMSDTVRTTLFDFTYDGTGSKITRADKVNNVDVDTSKISHALTSGDDYTYFEISLPLDLVGFDPAKQFGIYLTASDINLTDTGDKYDALNCSKYNGNAEAPWTTTKFFKSIFGYDIDPLAPSTVVSIGKTYTGSTAARSGWTDTDPATKLTDGSVGSLDKLGGSGPFVGYQVVKKVSYTYTSGSWTAGTVTYDPDERDENGNLYVVIDLGENAQRLFNYSVKFGQIVAYNILFPSKVQFYASVDGKNYHKVGDGVKGTVEDNGAATLKEWVDYTFTANSGITARYIKVLITPAEFTDEMTPAPTTAGTDGEEKVVEKALVTAVSEIIIDAKSDGAYPEYSETPVKKNGYAVDLVTNDNTTYPTGYDKYTASLTDNVASTAKTYTNAWYGFYSGGAANPNTVNGIGTIKVELGELKNVGGFRAHIWQPNASGIGTPDITVYGSINNFDWLEIGKLENPTEEVGWANLTLDYELPIKYVRFDVKLAAAGYVYTFLNEIEVLTYLHESTFSVDFANQYSVGYQNPATWTYNGGETLAGVGDAVYIYTPDKGKTLGEAANPGIAWWQVWVIDWDAEAKCYYIKEFHPVNNGSSKAGVQIPEKGFVVASCGHGNQMFEPILTTSVAIGAPVYVYGMDILKLGVKDTMDFVKTNTISVFAPIEGKTAYTPDFIPALPQGALRIDNFIDYVGSTLSIYTRIGDKITLGEVSELSVKEAKKFNMFYLVVVDSKGKVVAINQTIDANKKPESCKDTVEIPEGGYLLLCSSATNDTHTQEIIDAFLSIKVGDIITLYNVDLEELATGAVKTNLIKAGFTVKESVNYNVGVNNVSDPSKIDQTKPNLDVLTDGKKDLVKPADQHNDPQVVLFKNLSATTAGVYPSVELILNLGEEKTFNTIDLSFYINFSTMIGLPKDNLISISYTSDPENFVPLADYTFEGSVKSGDEKVYDANLYLGTMIKAQYVKIVFSYGDSPFQDKPVWEWIGFTEIGVSTSTVENLPEGAFVIDNYGGFSATTTLYTRNGGKTTIGEVSELVRGTSRDYNYTYLVAVNANGIVTEVNHTSGLPNGKKDNFVIPEGGYVLLCNLNISPTHTQAVIDDFKKIEVGDVIKLINVNLVDLATAKSEITLEKAGFTVTKVPALPQGALRIDNFIDYVGSTLSIYTRIGDKITLGEVSELSVKEAKKFNMFYLVVVDSDGKVVAINQTIDANKKPESCKDTVEIPEGGYLLLCSSAKNDTHTQEIIDAFLAIKVGDTITLHNVDLEALAAGAVKANLYRGGFTVTPGTQDPEDPFELKDPENTSVWIEDGVLYGITDTMTVEDIKALFAGEVTVEGVGTGKKIIVGDEHIVMLILGDLNGDGQIGQIDLLRVKKALIGNYTLTGLELKAACIRGESKPGTIDYLRMKKHRIGTFNIFDQNQG